MRHYARRKFFALKNLGDAASPKLARACFASLVLSSHDGFDRKSMREI